MQLKIFLIKIKINKIWLKKYKLFKIIILLINKKKIKNRNKKFFNKLFNKNLKIQV